MTLIFSNYTTDIGDVKFIIPISFFSLEDSITLESALNDDHIPVEIVDLIVDFDRPKYCLGNIRARRLELTTPDNLSFSLNSPVPFREVDLDIFVQNGYIVKTIGERLPGG